MNNDYETYSVPEDSYTIEPLHSVGCVIVSEGVGMGITYPMYEDGSWDESNGVYLEDCTDEWYDGLDTDDLNLVNRIKENS